MKHLYIIFGLSIFLTILYLSNTKEYFNEKACSYEITDEEYLKHMIPHHQVAIDMSILLQKKTKNPTMNHIIRKLMWVQNYEINLMKHFLKFLPKKSSHQTEMNRYYISMVSDFIKPNYLNISKVYCDPLFFDPKAHMKHMKHMKITDRMYIEHMIPHHQVAVDMSKKLLKNTNNDFMIYLAYRIIRSQQEEIILLHNLLDESNINYVSNKLN